MTEPEWARAQRRASCSRCACAISALTHRRHRARAAHRAASTPSSTRAAWRSARTTGCPTNGSRPTACPASPFRSTSRTRGSRSSSCAQMLEVEGGDPESCLRILRHEAGHAIDNAYQLRRRPTRRRLFGNPATPSIPSTTRRSRTARASSSISITGTRRAIPTKTSPRRSRCGSIRSRCGRRATPAGRRSASSNTWTG